MKAIFIIILAVTLSGNYSKGQDTVNIKKPGKVASMLNKLKYDRATDLFTHLAYSHAVNLYEELALVSYNDREVLPRLGDCYNNLSNTEKAEFWYAKAVEMDSIDPVYFYRYSQVLRSNGKYTESEVWVKRYSDYNSNDSRIKNLKEDKDLVEKLLNRNSFYKVTERKDLNSEFSDFGAVNLGNRIVFASGRTENLMIGTYYAWNDKPFLDLYVYDTSVFIKSRILPFSKSINTKYHEGPVCFANQGKTIYFTRDNYLRGKRNYSTKGTTCLMILKAELKDNNWTNETPLPFNNKEFSVGHPSVSPDERRLYFASDMPGSIGGSDIYYVDILGDNQYSEPVNLGSTINTEGDEMFPFITADGLYYSSDGMAGLGGLDIFYAKYDGIEWQKPVNLGSPVNSTKDDFSFVLNEGNRSGYFTSNRPGGTGDDDIYEFTINQLALRGVINDTTEISTPMEGVDVFLMNDKNEIVEKIVTDKNGDYAFNLGLDNAYTVKVSKSGYSDNLKSLNTIGVLNDIILNMNMGKEKSFSLLGTIKDKKSEQLLEGVDITIVDTIQHKLIIDTKTPVEGSFKTILENVKMNSHLAFQVILRKEGYLSKTFVFDHYISGYETNLNELLEISMDKIDLGVDIGKLLNINPIYFDLGKWNISPDAAIELDKVVQALRDNPTVVIELGSHTDSRGSDQSNMELSDKRAKASAEYIISKGIDSNRVYGKGYGESQLVNRCGNGVKCKEEEHAQNRRTEFKVVKF